MSAPIEDVPRPVDEPATARGVEITLTNHTLGLNPYVLIQAVENEPDGELRLKVEHNDDGTALAVLYLLSLPAEQNPITAAIKAVIDANGQHDDYQTMVETLHLFAEFLDVPMPESGK